MKLRLASLLLIIPATVGSLCGQARPDVATVPVAESGNLKAVARITNPANLTDSDWLQLQITNNGRAAKIISAAVSATVDVELHGRSTTHEQIPLGISSSNSAGNDLPAGTYTTGKLAELVGNILRLPDASEGVVMHLSLKIALEDGRSLATTDDGAVIPFTWSPPGPAQMKALQDEVVTLLLRSTPPLSNAEVNRMRLLLMAPAITQAITLDQALAALKQGQLSGKFQSGEVLGVVLRRWPNDPALIAFYREALASRGPAALADIFAGSPWDDSFIQPVIRIMEKAAAEPPPAGTSPLDRTQILDHGLFLLDRHYGSWNNDASIPPRLSRVVLQIHPLQSGDFYGTVSELEQTHDRGMILVLRPFLADKTKDRFTSTSSNMPVGVTPLRICDIAANGILNLMGEPEMISPWGRAHAPVGGPYPEWDDWDKKIATLQQRLGPDIVDFLKNLPTQIAGLLGPSTRGYGDAVEAIYNVSPGSSSPSSGRESRPLDIQVNSYASKEEAEKSVQMSLHITQMAPTSHQMSGDITVYKWDTRSADDPRLESHRITSRIGLHVVTVQGPSQEQVDKAYGLLVQQLGNALRNSGRASPPASPRL